MNSVKILSENNKKKQRKYITLYLNTFNCILGRTCYTITYCVIKPYTYKMTYTPTKMTQTIQMNLTYSCNLFHNI